MRKKENPNIPHYLCLNYWVVLAPLTELGPEDMETGFKEAKI